MTLLSKITASAAAGETDRVSRGTTARDGEGMAWSGRWADRWRE